MLDGRDPYSVMVVSTGAKGEKFILDLLPLPYYEPVISVKSANEAKRALINSQYDLIIINTPLSDEFGTEFAIETANNSFSGILLIVNEAYFEEVSEKAQSSGVLAIQKPMTKESLNQGIKLLCATRERLKKLEKKNQTLNEKIQEIRIVNRAKWLLIEYLKMSEPQAHRYIEKQAMDLRITRREVAENLIKTYES